MASGKGLSLVSLTPPSEITFSGPFTDVVTSYLKIGNPHSKPVCFKVKTTAPKQYCVRPNSGIVNPGDSATVAVMLQPIDAVPADAAKHKFMVQSCYAPAGANDLESFWKTVDPSELHYGKLRVVFDASRIGAPATPAAAAAVAAPAAVQHRPVGGASGDASEESPESRANISRPYASPSSGGGEGGTVDPRLKKLEVEVERLTRERADLLLKVQAANAKAAQAGDFPLPMVQMALMALAVLLLGLIVGKLF